MLELSSLVRIQLWVILSLCYGKVLGLLVAQTRPKKSAPSELLWSLSVNK